MIDIYRIQDKYGRGPFRPGFSHLWVDNRLDHNNLKPYFEEFPLIHYKFENNEYIGCGCKSKKQLRRWFNKKEYKKLKQLGFNSYKLQANRIIEQSDIQCVFACNEPFTQNIQEIELY